MARRHNKHIIGSIVTVIAVALSFSAAHNKLSINAGQSNPLKMATASGSCDASLWQHVYHPQRLQVITSCATVMGTIDHTLQEPDGDTHIRLKLDSQYSSMLNAKNYSIQHGDLVLEPVCEESPSQTDAVSSCKGYHSNVVVPSVGTHVKVVGAYVLDADHGWREIHPVTSIVVD